MYKLLIGLILVSAVSCTKHSKTYADLKPKASKDLTAVTEKPNVVLEEVVLTDEEKYDLAVLVLNGADTFTNKGQKNIPSEAQLDLVISPNYSAIQYPENIETKAILFSEKSASAVKEFCSFLEEDADEENFYVDAKILVSLGQTEEMKKIIFSVKQVENAAYPNNTIVPLSRAIYLKACADYKDYLAQ
jgi:hypothetical protein